MEATIQDPGAGRFGFSWGLSPWLAGGRLLAMCARDLFLRACTPGNSSSSYKVNEMESGSLEPITFYDALSN